jgi:hypothetical protein
MGNVEETKVMFRELKQRSANEFIDAVYMGVAAALAGNIDEAFNYMEAALVERDPMLITLNTCNILLLYIMIPVLKNYWKELVFPGKNF